MKKKAKSIPLYRSVSDHYRGAIEAGVLESNKRLPSLRDMMRMHGVSLSTAVQACRYLETEGFVEARDRSGYYVRGGALPTNLGHTAHAREDREEGRGLSEPSKEGSNARPDSRHVRVDLGIATCAPHLYPADELRKLTVAAMRDDPDVLASPAKAIGCTAFKQALARRALVRGVRVQPEDIIVTQGCSEALALALRATAKQGDTVILESPTYYGFLQLLDSLGLRSLELPTNPVTGLVIEAVEFALRDKDMRIAAVINMPTLHNPMGSTMSNEARERLVRLCELNDVALIEDDVYGEFHPSASQLKSQAAFETSGHVIYCSSLNKALSPGLRLGWMIGGRWHDEIEALKAAQSRPKEELAQRVAAKYLESGAFDRHLKRLHAALAVQREEMAACIRQWFPRGTEVSASDAGMLLWVKLPTGVSSLELCKRAMDECIRIVPGAMFSTSAHFDAYVRISCGSPLDEQRIGAVKRLGCLCSEIATVA